MIKIFLVEDEIVVRKGIKEKIDWQSAGYTLVGDASDGEIAYPMILKTQPDIIITDIKMPFIDGLTLSQMVREKMPWVKIIVLSGYDEFEFAQEAIKIGISDYIVKPVIKEKLLAVIDKVAMDVRREREQRALIDKYKKDMEEMYFLKRQRFFERLFSGEISVSEVGTKGKEAGVELFAGAYMVFSMSYRRKDQSDESFHQSSIRIEEKLNSLLEVQSDIILFNRSLMGWNFIVKGESTDDVYERSKRYRDQLIAYFSSKKHIHYFGGIGSPVQRIAEIADSYNDALRAHALRYVALPNQIVYASDMQNIKPPSERKYTAGQESIYPEKMSRSAIDLFLKTGSIMEIEPFIDNYCQSIGAACLDSDFIRQHIALDVFSCCKLLLDFFGCEKEKVYQILGTFLTIEETVNDAQSGKEYLVRLLTEVMTYRDMATKKKYDPILRKAKAYIEENYSGSDFSLNTVASHVNISASHFSTVFSQETGQTFTEYLTQVRIQKAKELLICTQKPSGEIGYLVGYKDAHYFSYIFKKNVGTTPSEYRAKGSVN